MKEHPIIFSTPMVQAILEGRKTMTRRIIKPQPECINNDLPKPMEDAIKELQILRKKGLNTIRIGTGGFIFPDCPYGQPGDLLWVRETWKSSGFNAEYSTMVIVYKAGEYKVCVMPDEYPLFMQNRWKPSIHMPKAAARIWLKVVNVRVERLQDISNEEARKEGVKEEDSVMGDFRPGFLKIWDKIHGPESWNLNPWVWVVEFERVDRVQADA
jgi:hypothetical protein